jgi:hypothetical protein
LDEKTNEIFWMKILDAIFMVNVDEIFGCHIMDKIWMKECGWNKISKSSMEGIF